MINDVSVTEDKKKVESQPHTKIKASQKIDE